VITIYHGVRPALPQAACCVHLGSPRDPAGPLPDWRTSPLWVAGKDAGGNTICCLVHGRHHGLYQRALTGIADIFGFKVRWVDTDALALRELSTDIAGFLTLMLFSFFPAMPGGRMRRSIDLWLGKQVLYQQEERS
jgi:hypothetical protein